MMEHFVNIRNSTKIARKINSLFIITITESAYFSKFAIIGILRRALQLCLYLFTLKSHCPDGHDTALPGLKFGGPGQILTAHRIPFHYIFNWQFRKSKIVYYRSVI